MRKFIVPLIALFTLCLQTDLIAQEDVLTEKGGFSLNAEEEHYFLFILNNRPSDLPELRGSITKYIWKKHPKAKLKITQIRIEGELKDVPMIHIKTFSNKAKAMAFYHDLEVNRPDFLQMGMTKDFFAVSKTNFQKIIRAQSITGYKPFFAMNY